jgi:hypothetical protein
MTFHPSFVAVTVAVGDGYTMTELVTWHRDVVRDGPSESLSQLGMGVVVELVMGDGCTLLLLLYIVVVVAKNCNKTFS